MKTSTLPRVLLTLIVGLLTSVLAVSAPAAHAADGGPADGPYFVVTPPSPFEEGDQLWLQVDGATVMFSAGCNDVTATADWTSGSLTLTNAVTTLMGCDPDQAEEEAWLATFMSSRPTWTAAEEGFSLTSGTDTLQFVPDLIMEALGSGTSLTGTNWRLVGIERVVYGRMVVARPKLRPAPTMKFQKSRVSFTTGCNTANAKFKVSGKRLRLGPVATTRVGCTGRAAAVERAVLGVLNGSVRYTVRNDRLVFRHHNRALVYAAR